MSDARAHGSPPSAGEWPARLASVLDEMVSAHEALGEAAREHRAALSSVDADRMDAALGRVQACLQRIAELEHQRSSIVREAVQGDRVLRARDRAGEPPPRLTELAQTLKGEQRDRLVGAAVRLREIAQSARREVASVRSASVSLLRHMEGLVQEIASRVSGAQTYAPPGRGASAPTPQACGIDLTH